MAEKRFGRLDAIRHSVFTIAHYADAVIKGEAVLIPVERKTFSDKIAPLLNPYGWANPERVVDEALQAPLTTSAKTDAERHYDLPSGTLSTNAWSASERAEV